ncbi:MAG: sporulation protein YqfD, partial [Oscillospiraceae bacterium]|nr:sporulation protein YqfD [Oscillospiraceae bacterium]
IAAEDAVLLSLNVRAGVTDKKAGQTVAAGETLIDSVKLDRSGQAVQRAADGEVWARVKKQYECRQPMTVSAQVPTGRLDRGWRLETAGRALEFPAASQAGEGWRVQEKERALTLMGFALPVTQVRILMVEYGQAEIKLSVEQAAAQAKWNCRRMLYEAYPDAQIRTESWMCEQDGGEVVCRWTVEFEADIARVAVSE